MGKLAGSVTFITGGSSGIGAAVARELARRGGDVVLASRRTERLQTLAAEIQAMGGRALIARCDVTRDGDLKAAVGEARDAFGRIDYVVANAGFGVVGRFSELRLEDYRRQFETNVFGVLRTVEATREALIASRGCLAIVGSVNGLVPMPGTSPYSMSKFAVHALARCLWYELRPHGVGVVLIAPGYVESEIRQVDNRGVHHPRARDHIPRWLALRSDKAARRIVRALCRRPQLQVITGHARVAVFLERHFPRLLHRAVYAFTARGRRT
jgi:NAD(P)-dependent dehydrogenase (short-subunit alcohol dehydrogenase family)